MKYNGEKNYLDLLQIIIDKGYSLPPAQRQVVGTRQINSWTFEHDLRTGFPLLTTKDLGGKRLEGIIHELLWFLRGDTNIKYLVDNGVNIWNKDAYNYYKKMFKEHNNAETTCGIEMFIDGIKEDNSAAFGNYKLGDLGPVYGKQWRNWEVPTTNHKFTSIDQIANLIKDIKYAIDNNYNNRRLIVSAWNVAEISDMALPPCHKDFQIILEPISNSERTKMIDAIAYEGSDNYSVPKYYLNLIWNQRSVDTFLGLPYNIASYGFLAHILGKVTNTIPKDLIGELRNVHLYDNHIEQAKLQLSREPRELPIFDWSMDAHISFESNPDIEGFLEGTEPDDFTLDRYDPHPSIKAEMSS